MIRKILTAILALVSCCTFAQQGKTPAFPGAEGFGRYTTGGRGGAVYHVTTLSDDTLNIQPGTFRHACMQKGTRTIVFDVSGTIHLKGELKLQNGNVTIAGQTAPGDGICIADYPFVIGADNVIIRYMRFRLGNKNVTINGADGWDGLSCSDKTNIVIDHCSVSWSIDECLSLLGCTNSTVQWCIVAQSLVNSGHTKGAHGYGGNWGGSGASFHHNLLAHHGSRSPRLGPRYTTQLDERMDMRNNVIYNFGGNGCYGGEAMNINIVNNYYKPGPGSPTGTKGMRITSVGIRTTEYIHKYPNYAPTLHVWGRYYVDGNINTVYPQVTSDNWTYGMYNQIDASGCDGTYTDETKNEIRINKPIPFLQTTTHTAEQAYEKVLAHAGASFSRDVFDKQIIDDTRNGKASFTGSGLSSGFVNSQDDNRPSGASDSWSAWPVLSSKAAPTDSDGDGMPDDWETSHGLNPNDKADGAIVTGNGYTNLEIYMNSLVEDITASQNAGGSIEGDTDTGKEETEVADEYEISAVTNTANSKDDPSPWTFNNGFEVINTAGKKYGPVDNLYLKYSKDPYYTITIPNNMAIRKIEFTGFGNKAVTALESVNGISCAGISGNSFPIYATGVTPATFTVIPDEPISKSITFKVNGVEGIFAIRLYPVKNAVTQTGKEYTISQATNTGTNTSAIWYFNNGITVTNEDKRDYSTGNNDCVKYSSGRTFTINLPEGVSIGRVKINGYDNYETGDSYIAELNGKAFSNTDYVFPKKVTKDSPPVMKEYTIDLDTPASGTLTFKPGGKQVVWVITLYTLPEITISEHSVALGVEAGPANVTLVRTLSGDYYNSFCVPFDISADKIEKVLGDARVLQFSSVNGSTMVFEETAEGIRAGVPCLIKPYGTVVNPRFEGVSIVSGAPESVTIDGCSYIGTYTKYAMEYGGTELMFNTRNGLSRPKQAPDNVMRGLRAYFRLPATQAASAKVMIPGGTTGIEEMTYDAGRTAHKGVYNLNGQYVGASAKGLPGGIYIVNGKKMVISNK